MDYSCDKKNKSNSFAAAMRFQRSSIALLCLTAIICKTPAPMYISLVISVCGAISLNKAEPLSQFYLRVVRRVLRRDLFSFKYIFPGSFLIESDADRFLYTAVSGLLILGTTLYHLNVAWWFIPVGIVAAGMAISSVTGVCVGVSLYVAIREWWHRRSGTNRPHINCRDSNCRVVRNLGPLYNRCAFCKKDDMGCMGLQINLTATAIIIILFSMALVGDIGRQAGTVSIILLLMRLGVFANKENDDLLISHYKIDSKNRELSVLVDAASAIASQESLDNILKLLTERLTVATDCLFARILLVAEDGCGAAVKAASMTQATDWDPAIGQIIDIASNPFLSSLAATKQVTTLNFEQIQEIRADATASRGLLGCSEQIQSMLIAPISMEDEFLGIIVIGESEPFDSALLEAAISVSITSLAKYAGIAAAIGTKNARQYQSLKKAHLESIMCLAETLETRDAYTGDHSDRTVEYTKALARELLLTPEQEERLQHAAILHDIGKIGIPDSILNKPSKLTDEEFAIMRSHPVKGANLVAKIHSFEHIAPLIRHHHERWDGGGYPDGLAGENIPIESRIVAVLDSYDAMTSDRVYRAAPGRDFAISELLRGSGTQFDPHITVAFLEVIGYDGEIAEQPLSNSA